MSPRRPLSIRRRLLLSLLVATAVFGTLALIDTWREAVRMANLLSDRVLAGSALVIAERASLDDQGRITIDIPYGALEMLSSTAQDRVFYRVDGPPGQVVTGYADLPVAAQAPRGGDAVFADALYKGAQVRLASLARAASTGIDEVPFLVTVAETTSSRQQLTRAIMMRSALRLALMMLGAAAIVAIAVTLSLRPLRRLGEAISERSPDDLSPVETPVPAEVRGLVATINLFMSRLDAALEGLRNFTGNAAHQLRTPLAVVRTQLALAARAPDLAHAQEAAAKGDAAVAHAERILAQLLLLAKVGSRSGTAPQPMDLTDFARRQTAEQIPVAADAGTDLGFEGEGSLWIRAEPLLLAEALQNLISNALLHTPGGTVVTVRVRRDGDHAVLEVEDNGPGIPDAARAAVIRRFARGESPAEGLGLGLPVVDEIARLFCGRLSLHDVAGGQGLAARISFDLDPRSAPAGQAA
ncbi:sensor histidine kinase [Paracoccus fistulariae]|uniref:histidine kinase n=1 Tax=Paracoccus fistulariae TaxID=658446 RepID=A0ABY7SM04_9RHOB|nr:sensor histidine kinase [Paracoccus fistulariae]MDB6179941.1 sensor histidine kinase [Paracoccus fistulariae]WCR08038.1 sensor histidine kinase [Paracoccus fistulariae]